MISKLGPATGPSTTLPEDRDRLAASGRWDEEGQWRTDGDVTSATHRRRWLLAPGALFVLVDVALIRRWGARRAR